MRYVSLLGLACLVGCGGGSSKGAADMGGAGDLAGATTPPTLIAGNFTAFAGVTTSGWAVVTDGDGASWALRLADGSRQKIADHTGTAVVWYDTALVEHDVATDGFGALAAWHADGPAVQLTDASPANSFGFSPPAADADGHVAYWTRNGAGALDDLVLDTLGQPAPHTVMSGVELSPSSGDCWPFLRFFAGRLLATHCATAGSSVRTLTSWDPASGAAVDLLASSQLGFGAHAAVGILTTSTSGALAVVAADGSGSPRMLASNIGSARLTPDGSAALAVVSGTGALERISLADPTTPTQLGGPVARVAGVSPDGKLVTYTTTSDPMTFATDLWLTSAVALQKATSLVGSTTSWPLGWSFTDDSAWALYLDAYDDASITGTLHALPTAGGSAKTLGPSVYDLQAAGGARLVFVDHYTGTYPNGRADVELVDLAHDGAPTKLATQALPFFWLSSDNQTLYYVQPSDGLHIVALP